MQEQSQPLLFEANRCREWIEAALEHSSGTHLYEDILHGLLDGRFQLWPAPKGCIVTEIVTFPRKRVVNGFLAGGDMEDVLGLHDRIVEWAKSQGCTAATINGRAGWARVYKSRGWQTAHTSLIKEF